MEAIQKQQVDLKSEYQLLVCMECGLQYIRKYPVCPFCLIRIKTRTRRIILSSSIFVLLGGIIWFIAGYFVLQDHYIRDYYRIELPTLYDQMAALALYLSGIFTFAVGLLMLKNERCMIAILFSIGAIILGSVVNYNLTETRLFLPLMINIYALLILVIFREQFNKEEEAKDVIWDAPSMRGTLSSPPPTQEH